ncbi:hypothetical protein EIP91_003822 [Steccherinum ochraceum]|uniref:Uncharacterized protein n=1 Tax=Steccherinum ochraceum TaxID=92696 RepID=A0A4R0R9X0_9APHY|nr:hypothetical protein EIP91_003822 [Steccherinum ochraceum]
MSPVLLSRTLDPLLGIFTGAFAYYLYENNPRTAPPPEERLGELIRWKMDKRNKEEEARIAKEERVDWQNLVQEANKKQ